MLTWSLTICTYNRPHFLTQTIGYALAQTRRPDEIIVVDGSDDWQANKERIEQDHKPELGGISLIYKEAKVRSLTCQRNQALELASSDIVFSLDDDIYLFADAAETVMKVYEADKDEEIAMVAGHFTSGAPKRDGPDLPELDRGGFGLKAWLREKLENQMALDAHFVPYWGPVRKSPVPSCVAHYNVFPVGLINGGRTTFRRKLSEDVRWSEVLRFYATHEDSDFSYRLSQKGRLVVAPDAGFFHADGNEGTTGRFKVNTIRVRNLMALHKVHSRSLLKSAWRLALSFGKFALLYAFLDPLRGRFTFPTVRAYAFGILQIPVYLGKNRSGFEAWYIGVQNRMYGDRYK